MELRLGEAEHLPARDGEADLVVMSLVLHHLSPPLEGLREAARALQPGKLFLLAEFDRAWRGGAARAVGGPLAGVRPRRGRGVAGRRRGSSPRKGTITELRPGLRLALYISRKKT